MSNLFNTLLDWLAVDAGFTWKYVGLRGGSPWWLFAALVAVAAAFATMLYSTESSLSRGRRIILSILRAITYGLVLFFLFAPVIGLERTQTVRPELLVLADRSTSMEIADPRQLPADRADAALATGAAKFALPIEQAEIAKAQRAAENCLVAMKQVTWDDIAAAQNKVLSALDAALAVPAAEGEASERPERITAAIQSISQRQKDLQTRIAQRSQDVSTPAEVVAQFRDVQDTIRRELETLASDLATASAGTLGTAQADTTVTRSAMLQGMLGRPEFQKLSVESDVHYFSFGEKLSELTANDGLANPLPEPQKATEKFSRGSDAIREAVAKYSSKPISGVVLLTDGAFNDEAHSPLATANWLKELGVPLYSVGLGLQSPHDVRLRSLMVQDVFFPKDMATIRVQVAAIGYSGTRTEVVAALDGAEIAKRAVELTDEPQFVELSYRVPENKGGTHKLSVSIPNQPGEVSTDNNRLEKPIRIIDQKIKVLFVEGRPRWEYRYLRVLLQRDPRLEVQFLMTQGDPDLAVSSKEYLARYPETPEEAFSYDLVILGDVSKNYFNQQQLERITELVKDRGGSLLMLAGEQYAPASYVDSPIADLLPVRPTRDFLDVPENLSPIPTAASRSSFAMLDESEAANSEAWKLVRSLHKLPRLEGPKPGATILLELPEGPNRPVPYPLVAWQYAGSGKVMYVGTDQLWRLRFKLGDRHHSRFWGQAIQFLALSRLLGENKRVRIEVDNANQVRIGARVELHASVLDPAYQPVVAEKYRLELTKKAEGKNPEGKNTEGTGESSAEPLSIELTAMPGSPGLYQGAHVFRSEGQYSIKAIGDDARFANSTEITVAAADIEGLEPAMQEAQLRKMSTISKGRYFSVREWPAIVGSIHAQQRVVVESKELDLWDRWPLFLMLLVSTGAEWFLRRRFNLV